MVKSKYLTAPVPSEKMPRGIPYIISNELAERFSFYGMRTILVIYMTEHLVNRAGELDVMTESTANGYYHFFVGSAYAVPLFGALLSDIFLGKYLTIMTLSVVYCLGHLALAVDETRYGLAAGLILIALGSGGIKPCVSAHVGDQFGQMNGHLITKVFGWFYFSINLGAFASTLLTPYLLAKYGPQVAFGVPGVLMLVATVAFWMGRNTFVHIPPQGKSFLREAFSEEGRSAVGKLCTVFAFVIVFWSLYDQTGSSWVLQAREMDRHWLGIEWLPSQVQAVNPILILSFIPLFNYAVYPLLDKYVIRLTELRKISMGLFLTAISFSIPIWVEQRIAAGETPNISWHIVAYVILTSGEVMVSITCLEFSYTQAPRKMKSFVSALFWLTIALGNFFASFVNFFIENDDGTTKLEGAAYFMFFGALMFVTAVVFVFVAENYKPRTYLQDEAGVDRT